MVRSWDDKEKKWKGDEKEMERIYEMLLRKYADKIDIKLITLIQNIHKYNLTYKYNVKFKEFIGFINDEKYGGVTLQLLSEEIDFGFIVNQKTIEIELANDANLFWKYSTDEGDSWTDGSGNSFELEDNTYKAGQIIVKNIVKFLNSFTLSG